MAGDFSGCGSITLVEGEGRVILEGGQLEYYMPLDESFRGRVQASANGCDIAPIEVTHPRIYVNPQNTGGIEDGTSWSTAYRDLSTA
ncbi:MAG: hypothetical protein IH978_06305, partial [Nitrospinae bacterium]|nr:hypothetical protein [Nitrospinota bacterium]